MDNFTFVFGDQIMKIKEMNDAMQEGVTRMGEGFPAYKEALDMVNLHMALMMRFIVQLSEHVIRQDELLDIVCDTTITENQRKVKLAELAKQREQL